MITNHNETNYKFIWTVLVNLYFVVLLYDFSALTLLVGQQERYLACIKQMFDRWWG